MADTFCLQSEEREKDTAERIRVANILIAHGAFVDAENRQGKTALVYGRPEIRTGVELFMKAKYGPCSPTPYQLI